MRLLLYGLICLLACAVGWLVWRYFRDRGKRAREAIAAEAVPEPNVADEDVTVDSDDCDCESHAVAATPNTVAKHTSTRRLVIRPPSRSRLPNSTRRADCPIPSVTSSRSERQLCIGGR